MQAARRVRTRRKSPEAILAEVEGRKGTGGGAPEERVIPQIRTAVEQRVERTSLRSVAREIGMSPSGLKKFLDGNAPYTKTVHRLRNWYVQHAADQDEIGDDDAHAALRVLVHDLPPGMQAETVEAMLHCMEQGYTRSRRPLPQWMAEIRERYGLPAS